MVVLSPLSFSSSLFIPAFLHLRLPGRFSPSTRLHADRNIANSESSLIASSDAQHLVLPSPLKEQLQFFIPFSLNGWNAAVNLSLFSPPSMVDRIILDLVKCAWQLISFRAIKLKTTQHTGN